MPRPLEGLRVVDFTQMFAGPGTGMYLADQGADVIKIEPPNGGRDRAGDGYQNSFLVLNRGKRSLVLDIRRPDGREVAERLVKRSDVMLIAWPPGQAERLGYDYERMRALNPRLVYANITGWGEKGPLALKEGYDRLMQAYTGITASKRGADGVPQESAIFVADMSIPMVLAYGIMLALWARERTGEGQRVATSQLEAQIAMQSIYLVFPERADAAARQANNSGHPSHVYRTQDDRYLTIVPILEAEWTRLWECLELPEIAADPSLQSDPGRNAQLSNLQAALAGRFATRPLAAWLEALEAARVPHAPVLLREEFVDHPQAWENGMLTEVDHPVVGRTKMMALPVRLSGTPGQVGGPAPGFGQHTTEILHELGYPPRDVEALYAEGTVR
jgi:crotonobetainyl-CoA:carnitine CoA-transferase CaiB-like acyl-CoA transferase